MSFRRKNVRCKAAGPVNFNATTTQSKIVVRAESGEVIDLFKTKAFGFDRDCAVGGSVSRRAIVDEFDAVDRAGVIGELKRIRRTIVVSGRTARMDEFKEGVGGTGTDCG